MLRPVNRMRRRAEYGSAVRRGRRAGNSLLVVHLRRLESGEPPRVGFTVSRAVGGAVSRNRVRRRLRHLMRERVHLVPEGGLVVVRAHRAAVTASYAELADRLDRALERALRSQAQQAGKSGRRG